MVRLLLILLIVAFPLAGSAQAPEGPLDLNEAVRLALLRNPEVLIAVEQLEELQGRIQEVKSEAYPQLRFQGFGSRWRDPSFLNSGSFDDVPPEFKNALVPRAINLFDVGVGLKQPLYTAGKIRNGIRLAEEGQKEKEAALEAVRRGMVYKVFEAFHNLLLAQENLAVVLETRDQLQKHLDLARKRFSSGVATEIDVLRSEVNLANTDPQLIRAQNEIQLSRSSLNNLIVVDLENPTQIVGKLQHRPWAAPPILQLAAQAMEILPEVLESRRQLNEARLLLALAKAENKLSVDLEANLGLSTRSPDNFFNTDYSRWNLTVNFRLPFYDGGRKAGLVVQASSRVRASEHALRQLENGVKLEIKRAYDAMEASAEAIEAARLSVAQAERVLTMMQSNYEYGAATTLDVVDSQAALTIARNSEINATYLYEMAKARLKLAAGSQILGEEVQP
jgi:outer membrane protein TolC